MTQTEQDWYQEASDFLRLWVQEGESLVAPVKFKQIFLHAHSYDYTYLLEASRVNWLVLRQGALQHINPAFLKQALQRLQPVLANPEFVVFSSRTDLEPVSPQSPSLQAIWQQGEQPHSRLQRLLKPLGPVWQRLANGRLSDAIGFSTLLPKLAAIEAKLNVALSRLSQIEQTLQRLPKQGQPLAIADRQPGKLALRDSRSIISLSVLELAEVCRAACQTIYIGNDTLICRVLAKYLLYADSQDIGIVPHLCFNGFWETGTTMAIARAVQSGWYCLDVGANHGYYSLLMAGLTGPSGRVMAIEPTPRLASLVQQTLTVNGFQRWTSVRPVAAFDRSGETMKLRIPSGHGMNARLIRHAISTDQIADAVVEVEVFTLDQLTADWPRVDLIKIDVEGAEEGIWRGMLETLRRHPKITIVLEFNTQRYADPRAFLQAIEAEGFRLRCIEPTGNFRNLTIDQCLTERPRQDQMLFLQRSPQ